MARLTRTLLVTAVATLAAAPAAGAAWSPATQLSDPADLVGNLQLVTSSSGRALVGWDWRQFSGVVGTTVISRRPDARWGPQTTLGGALTLGRSPEPRTMGMGETLGVPAAYGGERFITVAPSQPFVPR